MKEEKRKIQEFCVDSNWKLVLGGCCSQPTKASVTRYVVLRENIHIHILGYPDTYIIHFRSVI